MSTPDATPASTSSRRRVTNPPTRHFHKPDPETSPKHQRGIPSPRTSPLREPRELQVSEDAIQEIADIIYPSEGRYENINPLTKLMKALAYLPIPAHVRATISVLADVAFSHSCMVGHMVYRQIAESNQRDLRTEINNVALAEGYGLLRTIPRPNRRRYNGPCLFELRLPEHVRARAAAAAARRPKGDTSPALQPAPEQPSAAPAVAPTAPSVPVEAAAPAAPTPPSAPVEAPAPTVHENAPAVSRPRTQCGVCGTRSVGPTCDKCGNSLEASAAAPRRGKRSTLQGDPGCAPSNPARDPQGVPPALAEGAIAELIRACPDPYKTLDTTAEAFAAQLWKVATRRKISLRWVLIGVCQAADKCTATGSQLRAATHRYVDKINDRDTAPPLVDQILARIPAPTGRDPPS